MSFRPTAQRLLFCLVSALWLLSELAGGSRVESPNGEAPGVVPSPASRRISPDRSSSPAKSRAGSPAVRRASAAPPPLVAVVRRAARFAVSAPARTLKVGVPSFVGDREIPERRRDRTLRRGSDTSDPVVQGIAPPAAIPAPLVGFEGINNQDNFNVYAGYVVPPDTEGDVGPNHYVQAVNLLFRVFNKSGTALTAPLPISTLFAPLGGLCATTDEGDPIVLYDPLADRWLITQFVDAAPAHECVALSRTGDPAGSYFLYDFVMPNSKFNDYPKFGVWPDAYYMSDNQFDPDFQGAGVFALDRSKMLVGDPTAAYIYFDLENLDPTIGGILPSDLDGLTPPPAGAPNVFAYFTATEFGDAQDGLRLFSFHADFGNPAASTFTERPESPVAVAAFDPTMNEFDDPGPAACSQGIHYDFRDDIPQPDASGLANCRRLDSISDRLMFRLQYRNFGTHESLVTTHSVDVNFSAVGAFTGHKAGIRYYELRRALPAGSFSVNEQASFAPDADHRWMGSAAMDASGDLAVGYSVSGSATFPSIRYAGRLAGDPPNGLAQGETTLQAGGGIQETITSRWGDYSMLAVDPVDECTFWYTTEYYAASLPGCTGNSPRCWQTRIGSFKFPSCATPPRGTLQGAVTDSATSAPIAAARVVMVEAGGATYETATNGSGSYSRLLPPGSYTATASAAGYSPSAPTPVTVINGTGTSQNFSLGAGGGPTPTPTRTPTPTPVPPTATPTLTPTSSGPSPTPTRTPTPTPTSTQTPTPTLTPPSVPGASYNTVPPCRIADTRNSSGPLGGPSLQAGAVRNFPVGGVCSIPTSAKAVAVNVTIVNPTAEGHLTLYPAGTALPLASTINFRSGIARANNAVLPLGTSGQVSVFCGMGSGSVHFVLDVAGYFE